MTPGEEGKARFQAAVRRIFELAEHEEMQLTFDCQVPAQVRGQGLQILHAKHGLRSPQQGPGVPSIMV